MNLSPVPSPKRGGERNGKKCRELRSPSPNLGEGDRG